MYLQIAFYVSGALIALMLLTKKIERKHQKTFVFSKALSLGDKYASQLASLSTKTYEDYKDRLIIFFTKQAPLKMRVMWNKQLTRTKEWIDIAKSRLERARMLKSSDQGISGYLKSLSEKEKEEEIQESFGYRDEDL